MQLLRSGKEKILYLLTVIVSSLLLIWPSRSYAEPGNNTLKGVVTDKNNHPLIGAIVQIPDLKVGTSTDMNGRYHIDNLQKGKYLVEVSLISYATKTATVEINGVVQQNFSLGESAIEGKEIVITGQSKATEIRRSPVPIVAINADYLRENVSTNAIDAISKVPGVTAVTTGPNVSKPFIRGLGYNRVLTLYDGMRQEGQQWGDEHGVEVDEYNIDRVEVIKGPASLIYGSDALAGVVNLIPTPPAPEGKIIGNITTEYQTNNGMAGGSGMVSGNKKGLYWLGRLSYKEAKNYLDPVDGRVYGTNYRETDGTGTIGLNRKWGHSQLSLTLFDDLQAIPDGSRDSATNKFTKQVTEADTLPRPIVSDKELNSYAIPVLHQHVQFYRAMLDNTFNVLNGQLDVNLGFERSVRREYSHPEYADLAGLYLQLNTYIYDVKYNVAEFDGWNVTAGVNGMYQVNDVTQGSEFIIPSYKQFDIGPFAMVKRTFGKLDVSGGMRYDSRTFNNDALYTDTDPVTGFDTYAGSTPTGTNTKVFDNYNHTFSGFTYSLGLTYAFTNQLSVKANLARGYRSPNIAEISANGVHPGTNIYQIGNPDFKPEFSTQEDIGLDYTSRHVSVSFAVFNNTIANYIYNAKVLAKDGQDSVIVPGNQTFQFEAAKAQLYGGELSVDIHPHPLDWLHFENSLSVVYGINKGVDGKPVGDSAKYLPFIPPLHGISELRANFKKPYHHLKNTFIKVQVAYYAAQNNVYSAYGTETPTPGYALFNAGIGADITDHKGKTMFNVAVFGDNLFDVAYQDHLSRLKYFQGYASDHAGIYNMGRNIGIKVSVPLTF